MNHWLKIVSIVELDPPAMLTIRLSKNIIDYDVRWASRPVGLLLFTLSELLYTFMHEDWFYYGFVKAIRKKAFLSLHVAYSCSFL